MTPSWFNASMLPGGWQALPLRQLGRVLNGGTPTSDPVNWDGPFPFVTPPDLNGADGALVETTGRTLTKTGTNGSGLAPAGSVLASTRAPIGHVGQVGVLSAFNQGCRAIVPRAGVEPRYVAIALVAARAELIARGQGATFVELSSSAFASVPVPLPPPDEQRAIADYLDQERAQIDALAARQEEFIGLLRERRDAVVRLETAQSSTSCSIDKLGRSAKVGNGSTPRRDVDAYWRGGNVPWLTSTVVNRREVDAADQFVTESAVRECHLPMLEAGTLLIGLIGQGPTRGMATISRIRATLSQNLAYIAPNKDEWMPEYLLWALRSAYSEIRQKGAESGAAQGMLNTDDIRRVRLPMPPIAEQRRITERLDGQIAQIDALMAKAEEHIALVKERRFALITAAVTGQIDVRTTRRAC